VASAGVIISTVPERPDRGEAMTTTTPQPTATGPTGTTRAVAWSMGGRVFDLETSLSDAPVIGGFVVLGTPEGRRLLGQVVETRLVDRPGAHRAVLGSGTLLADVSGPVPQPAGPADRFEEATVTPADATVVQGWTDAALGDRTALITGEIRSDGDGPAGPARLIASGFNRHTFLCGQSGSGKTYSLGLLLERLLLQTELRMVVLDPNSDYVHLDRISSEQDLVSPDRLTDLARRTSVLRGGHAERPLAVRFGRFRLAAKALLLGLDPLRDAEEYDLLRTVTERRPDTEYEVADLLRDLEPDASEVARRLTLRIRNLGVLDWAIWAGERRPALDQLEPDWRALVLDLGSLHEPYERSVVAAATLSTLWERRHERQPVLIVIDEAHNVCPQNPTDPHQALAVEHAERIAAEGRKYGLYLLLATQSPRKLHANVLGQCENLLLMRTNSLADVQHLGEVFSHVPAGLIRQAPTFRLGEGLAAGRIVPAPLLFRGGRRLSPEGGADVPTTWAGIPAG
jgi:uncharacterized protein